MKKLMIALIAILSLILSVPVSAGTGTSSKPTVDTWEYCGCHLYGEEVNGMRVMTDIISSSSADGETNYATVYTECETPPLTIPANEEIALKVRIHGDVKRNDRGRGIYMSCQVVIASPNLDRSDSLNGGSSMNADDYSALSWGNYAGGFGPKETIVRGKMYSSDYKDGDMLSIYFRNSYKQCEWRYKLRKADSSSSSAYPFMIRSSSGTKDVRFSNWPSTVPRNKKTTVKIKASSGVKLEVKGMNARASNKKNVRIIPGKTVKLVFQKKAKKGNYRFAIHSPGNKTYKDTVIYFTIKVK